jgi:hypothetical protein
MMMSCHWRRNSEQHIAGYQTDRQHGLVCKEAVNLVAAGRACNLVAGVARDLHAPLMCRWSSSGIITLAPSLKIRCKHSRQLSCCSNLPHQTTAIASLFLLALANASCLDIVGSLSISDRNTKTNSPTQALSNPTHTSCAAVSTAPCCLHLSTPSRRTTDNSLVQPRAPIGSPPAACP